MKKIHLLLASGGGMFSSLAGGVMGLFQGTQQREDAKREEKLANQQYDSAYANISANNDPELEGQRGMVRRIMTGLRTGAINTYAGDQLSGGVRGGADVISSLAGGNTGGALATIGQLQTNANDAYNKMSANNQGHLDQLLGLDTGISEKISDDNRDNDKMRAEFWKMRGEQNLSRALSDKKSGDANINAGVMSFANFGDDVASMGSGGGGAGGSGGGGGGMGGMFSGIMSMFGGGK